MWVHTAVIWLVHGPLPVSSTLGKQQKATYKHLSKYRAGPPPQSSSLLSLYPLGRNMLHVRIISCFWKYNLCKRLSLYALILSVRTWDSPLEILAEALKFLEGLFCSVENFLPKKEVHQVGTDVLTATGHAEPLLCLHCTPREKGNQHERHCTQGPTLKACLKSMSPRP